jgi:hypothetical protein
MGAEPYDMIDSGGSVYFMSYYHYIYRSSLRLDALAA